MSAIVQYPHLHADADGQVRIEGTRYKVLHLAGEHYHYGWSAEELLAQNITIFKDRVRIDVQIATPGILFEDAWARRHTVEFKGQRVYVLCKDDLIASKRAAGRPVDLQDVEMLRQVEPG